LLIIWWRTRKNFEGHAVAANTVLLLAGFLLTQYQLLGYFFEKGA
jgi:hypothetical protein